jgi:hypothetical protein
MWVMRNYWGLRVLELDLLDMYLLRNGYRVGRRGTSFFYPLHVPSTITFGSYPTPLHPIHTLTSLIISTSLHCIHLTPSTPRLTACHSLRLSSNRLHRISLTLQPPPRPSPSSDIRAPPKNPRYPTPNRCAFFKNLQPPKRFNNIRITPRTSPPVSRNPI